MSNPATASKVYGAIPLVEADGLGHFPMDGTTISTISNSDTARIIIRNKQGHVCCGGCCDVRRAVIVVNIVMISFCALGWLGLMSLDSIVSNGDPEMTLDDDMIQELESESGWMRLFIILELVAFGVILYGALEFRATEVGIGIAVYGWEALSSLWMGKFAGVIMHGLFLYPHVFLYQEIKQGIMTRDNYHNEKQSCCCV